MIVRRTYLMIYICVPRLARGFTPIFSRELLRHQRLVSIQPPWNQVRWFASSPKESQVDNNYDVERITDDEEGLVYFDSFQDTEDDMSSQGLSEYDQSIDDGEGELQLRNPMIDIHLAWSNAVHTTVQNLVTKGAALQRELEKAKALDQTVVRAQLLVGHLYRFQQDPTSRSIVVQDWDGLDVELTLDPQYETAAAEADALFAQARKLKRGSAVVQDLLIATDQVLQMMKQRQLELEAVLLDEESINEEEFLMVQEKLKQTAKQTNFRHPQPPTPKQPKPRVPTKDIMETSVRKFISPGGCIVLVGRNRRGNDHVSMHVARGNDIWMHARGRPGAHVVLQSRRGSPPVTQACLDFCANVAAFYSDARTETKAEITAAEPKHVLKPRGAPLGAVKVREELYTLTGWPELVPDELKMAREQSGMTDEFRAKDKQKHRRKTADVAKQAQVKKRADKRAKRKGGNSSTTGSDGLPDFFE